jgi:hypothetical protein
MPCTNQQTPLTAQRPTNFGFIFSRLKVALSFNWAALQLRLMWLIDRFSPPYSS